MVEWFVQNQAVVVLTRPSIRLEHYEIRSDFCREASALPLPLAGEGGGGGCTNDVACVEKAPHPAVRVDLPIGKSRSGCGKPKTKKKTQKSPASELGF
jgi:hypothetical protein